MLKKLSHFCCALLAVGLGSLEASPIVGLTTGNQLVFFGSNSAGAASGPITVTGLLAGHTLTGIDFRPIDGVLAGVSRDSAGNGQVYTINTSTGAATAIGGLFSVLPGITLAMDFNPVPNALRLVTDGERNLRITMGGAGTVNTDTNLTRTSGSPDPDLRVVSAAYSNNIPGGNAGATTLYVIDALTGSLYNQGILNFAAPTPANQGPNGGLLTLIGSLGRGTNLTNNIGFDINNVGQAFVSIDNELYTIDVATGNTTPLGTIGGNVAIRDIAASSIPEPSTVLLSAFGVLGLITLRRKR
jgi:hypothetical protein